MSTKHLKKEILRLALPYIIGNITIQLLGFVDLALMGELDSPSYMGAIALGTQMFSIIYWAFGFLRMSTGGLCAQAFGAKEKAHTTGILYRSLSIALILGCSLLFFREQLASVGLQLLEGGKLTQQYAREYFFIRIWAAPAAIAIFSFSGWFLGIQDAQTPFWITIVINLLNLALSSLLVLGFELDHRGAAWGTVIAQYTGLFCFLFILIKRHKRYVHCSFRAAISSCKAYLPLIKIGGTLFFRTLCIISVFTFFTKESAAQGDEILASNTIIRELILFVSFFMDGLAHAAEALVGRFIGERNQHLLKRCVRQIFLYSTYIAVVFTLIYLLFGSSILSWMNRNNPQVFEIVKQYLIWVYLIPILSFSSFIWDGIFAGMARAKAMLVSVFIASLGFFFPAYYLLQYLCGEDFRNHILLGSMLGFMFVRGLVLTFYYYKDH